MIVIKHICGEQEEQVWILR